MTPEAVLSAIKSAVGNPSCGPIKDCWGDIEAAVHRVMSPGHVTGDKDGGASSGDTPFTRKETRIIKATETPEG